MVGVTEAVGDGPVTQAELRLEAERLGIRLDTVGEIAATDLARRTERQHDRQRRRKQRIGAAADPGRIAERRIGIGAGHQQRRASKGRHAVVEQLAINADIAAVELLGDVELHLTAARGVEPGFTDSLALAVEAADVEAPAIAQLATIVEIGAIAFKVDAHRRHHRSAFDLSGLRDEVDDAARRVRGEGRGRSATDRFDLADIEIGADEDIGRQAHQIAEFHHRKAIFLDLDILAGTIDHRQPANGIVVLRLTGRRLDADPRYVAEKFGQRPRRQANDVVLLDRAGRGRAVQPVAAACHTGGNDIAFIDRAACLPGSLRLVFLRRHRRCKGGNDRDSRCTAIDCSCKRFHFEPPKTIGWGSG